MIKKFLDLDKKNRISIAVVGDVMVDEYYDVVANRISPEFPIPIMLSSEDKPTLSLPGGAANVAEQFKHFNVDVKLFGFADKSHDFNVIGPIVKQLPIKKRFYQGDFPLCRWDVEDVCYGQHGIPLSYRINQVYKEFCEVDPKIVIFSDYNKGFFTDDVSKWLENRISIVDPKKGPISKWKGCTVIKPNSVEAEAISGFKDWKKQADYFEQETNAIVLITQGKNGVVGKINGEYFEYHPKKTVTANSVIGAGDCFMAFYAMAIERGFSYLEAVEIAFEAGCVYVQNKHNCPIKPCELLHHDDPIAAKLINYQDLANRDFSLVFANGCFDILHEGHIGLLKYAKSLGDKLVVALNSDDSIKRIKGDNRPINSLKSRIYMLSMLEFVDFIISFEEETPLKIIQEIKPEKIVKGAEYSKDEVIGKDDCGEVVLFPYQEGFSTTNILSKI